MRVIGLALLLGCGPRVVEAPADDASGESGGEPGTSSSDGSDGTDDTGGATVFDEGSGGPLPFCGDGVLDIGEACDDGNDVDADGCSPSCELSGSVSWQVELLRERGFGVGLDVLDGEAYVLVEDYGDGIEVQAISSRVSTLGQVVASYAHEEGLADPDVTRDPIAVLPDGQVVVGYPSPEGWLARIDLAAGPLWIDPLEGWTYSSATRWREGSVYTVRRSDENEFALLQFTDTGDPIDTLWLDAADGWPLSPGALFVNSIIITVFTWAEGSPLLMHGLYGDWKVEPIGKPTMAPPRAFAHGLEIAIWTETERIMIDNIGHTQPAEPRTVLGDVLTSFPGGFVIQTEQHIDVYDDAGTLRWSLDAALVPRIAMLDGIGGLLVLSDPRVEPGTVILERLVL